MAIGNYLANVTQIIKDGTGIKNEHWITRGSTIDADSANVARALEEGALTDITPPPAPVPPPPPPASPASTAKTTTKPAPAPGGTS